jgi:ElaB/YqjD/DUF883 family membrane-anchored ribosome-binding protein
MNSKNTPETDVIRSDIDVTRRRMDDTLDALGNRLQGRHLIDEIFGFFRRRDTSGKMQQVRDRISESANSAAYSIVDTVKANPMPALLIGAGVAWMIYESRREDSRDDWRYRYPGAGTQPKTFYDPDTHYDRPLDYPAGAGQMELSGEGHESKFEHLKDEFGEKTHAAAEGVKEKMSAATENVKEKMSHLGEQAREKFGHARENAGETMHHLRDQANELGSRVQEKAHDAYVRTRQRVVSTAEQHPLEVGLGCLAAGLLIGLALKTPQVVNRVAGPTADRLRDRTREAGMELAEKSKRVAEAATHAVKEEAEAQGLTPEHLAEKAGAVAERAGDAADEAVRRETEPNTPQGGDPSLARPGS